MKRKRIPVDPELEARAQRVEQERAERRLRYKRREVMRRHARLLPPQFRKAMQCTPSEPERIGVRDHRSPGSDDKVIFDTREAANACAAELEKLTGFKLRPYHCPRHRPGHEGHWHLTTDGYAARAIKNQVFRSRAS